jgi:hypothetical protein
MGNPYKLSPKATIKSWLGYGFPFDRHDWMVDRGDRLVHYIIDYYYNPVGPANPPPAFPGDPTAPVLTTSIYVDVRPAVEDVGSVLDRLRHFPRRALQSLKRPFFKAEGIDPSKVPLEEKEKVPCVGDGGGDGKGAKATAPPSAAPPLTGLEAKWAEVDSKCSGLLEKLKSKTLGEDERRSTQVALNYCMGRALCPSESGRFMKALEANEAAGVAGMAGGGEEEAFGEMTKCVMAAAQARGGQRAAVDSPLK